jgi:hypothetical protein
MNKVPNTLAIRNPVEKKPKFSTKLHKYKQGFLVWLAYKKERKGEKKGFSQKNKPFFSINPTVGWHTEKNRNNQ